jgi:hypothetical protein
MRELISNLSEIGYAAITCYTLFTLKTLVQVNSSFDLFMCTAVIAGSELTGSIDLLMPASLQGAVPDLILAYYSNTYFYGPRLKNLLSVNSLVETIRLSIWIAIRRSHYSTVIFGAYRNDVTSVIAKYLTRSVRMMAIKQGVDPPAYLYKRTFSLRTLHDDIYYYLFGISSFYKERMIGVEGMSFRTDYFFSRPVWKTDPFNRSVNVYTIGSPTSGLSDGTPFLLPDFQPLKVCSNSPSRDILVIGERTPMTPSWGLVQQQELDQLLDCIIANCSSSRIYLRPRKNLTDPFFYSKLNPIVLDSDQPYDSQLLKLNPRIVISVKSTACKVSAYYGIPSAILYPAISLSYHESLHLGYLFGDGAPVVRIKSVKQLASFCSLEVPN